MTAEQAPEVELRAALEEVRARFDAGADDWQYGLLKTFRDYLRALGFERRLIDPVQAFLLQRTHEIRLERRDAEGKVAGAPPAPIGAVAARASAVAAVTTLKNRHAMKLADALAVVAEASGFEASELRKFRDNLSRGGKRAPAGARKAYDIFIAELRDKQYSADDIIQAVAGIAKFVGNPAFSSHK